LAYTTACIVVQVVMNVSVAQLIISELHKAKP